MCYESVNEEGGGLNQDLRNQYKFQNFAIFYHANFFLSKLFTFSVVFANLKKRLIQPPPPPPIRDKDKKNILSKLKENFNPIC